MRKATVFGALFLALASQAHADDTEDVAALAKVSKDAEVHTVALYEALPGRFRASDATDWPKLIGHLKEGKSLAHTVLTRDLSNEVDTLLAKVESDEVAPARPGPANS